MQDKSIFTKAIESVGSEAFLFTGDNAKLSFKASVQPVFSGASSAVSQFTRIGAGERKAYKIFTPCDDVTAKIREGRRIVWQGQAYIVEKIEDMILGGEVCFREGLIRKQEPDYMEAENGRT